MRLNPELKLVGGREGGPDPAFREDVLRGLSEPQKAIPARWFYDLEGSRLFEEITGLAEYYLTRTETNLLASFGPEIASAVGPGRTVVEFGSGSSVKTPLLLREISPSAYVPLDISAQFLRQSSEALAEKFPKLPVYPVVADFMRPVRLPAAVRDVPLLGFFPGSTIGNLVPASAVELLRSMRNTLGDGSKLLIGFDTVKPMARLIPAYDDLKGVTARFNLNLLTRINRELGADIPVEKFRHKAIWNPGWSRIEMHLEAGEDLGFTISGQPFKMLKGETIHTENSHKYTIDQARLMLQTSGWTPTHQWTNAMQEFLIVLADATEFRSAP